MLSSQDAYRGSFRFDKRMLYKPLVKEAISRFWNSLPAHFSGSVADRVRNCRKALSIWKQENSLNAKEKIGQIQRELESMYSSLSPSFYRMDILKRELVVNLQSFGNKKVETSGWLKVIGTLVSSMHQLREPEQEMD